MKGASGPLALRELTLESPAKLNLCLAITGARPDGFHNLVSLVAPVDWGDTLNVAAANEFSLQSTDPTLPVDGSNLVLKAAFAFRDATGFRGGAAFHLTKRIPVGAGLGGGSSNAAAALVALNQLSNCNLPLAQLAVVAAEVGSDCPLFLHQGPVVMRGRGDVIEPLGEREAGAVSGRSVVIFKPGFGVSTPWAFARLRAGAPASYMHADEAEARLSRWTGDPVALESLLFNSMEGPVFKKFPAMPALLEQLRAKFGLQGRMSGSGSACFALLPDHAPVDEISATIRAAWGESALVLQTRLA
ncbi:MAG: 4-(cytidine 5'-diphospho)-2-C-methyl-D-erythritol kinase [Opitutus sp.]